MNTQSENASVKWEIELDDRLKADLASAIEGHSRLSEMQRVKMMCAIVGIQFALNVALIAVVVALYTASFPKLASALCLVLIVALIAQLAMALEDMPLRRFRHASAHRLREAEMRFSEYPFLRDQLRSWCADVRYPLLVRDLYELDWLRAEVLVGAFEQPASGQAFEAGVGGHG